MIISDKSFEMWDINILPLETNIKQTTVNRINVHDEIIMPFLT